MKKSRRKTIALILAIMVASVASFISFGYGNDNNAYNIETGDYYYGEMDDQGTRSSTKDSTERMLGISVRNGFSTEKLERSFKNGNALWLKQVMIEYGKYPMNPVSITEWEEDGKYWPKCIGTPGYTADLSVGNEYPQNSIGGGQYYVDGEVSTNPADAGKPVDISMIAPEVFDWDNGQLDKYLYHPEEILTADYSDQRVVTTLTNVTVKDIPHPTGKALGSVTAGTIMEVTGITSNGWFRVNYNGQEAYIYYMFLG